MRTIVFFDGQNLYHGAKSAWGEDPQLNPNPYVYPSYDVEKLAKVLAVKCAGETPLRIRFYTGVPGPAKGRKEQLWHGFWSNKLRYLASRGIHVYKGRVNPGGQEKGVDVSLAIDLIKLTYDQEYEIAIIVSQDWDFGPAVKMAKTIAKDQQRLLSFYSAFCVGPETDYERGIPGTKWIQITKPMYDACLDPTDYRISAYDANP